MTVKYKTRGFVFKKSDRNDSDRVFSIFSEDFGRLDVFAKAIRKNISKLRSGIDIFFMSEIEFIQGKNRKTLTDAVALDRLTNIGKDSEKYKLANRMGEALDNLIRGEEKDENIYFLLDDAFCKLNDELLKIEKYSLLYYYFLWSVLSLLGYKPEVNKCNICRERLDPSNVYFSEKAGGVFCKKCLTHDGEAKKINSDIVKILRLIFEKNWQILSKLKVESTSQELFQKISDDYYFYILSSHSFKNISRVSLQVV